MTSTTGMAALVAAYQRMIAPTDLMRDLRRVAAVDRLQGSTGLAGVADDIAEQAERLGLQVEIRRYAPGHRWWNFTAPEARSAVAASLTLGAGAQIDQITSYPEQPCALGRGSASTPADGLTARIVTPDTADVGSAFVLCPPQDRFALGPLIDRLAAARAAGLAIETPARQIGGPDAVDRLELPDSCPLVGFSVSINQAGRLRAAMTADRPVVVRASHEPTAPMPVVYARHPGKPGVPRGLLMAHLCHPAPSANDNASGVSALLGIGRAVQQLHPSGSGPDLSFLWAPEMVGTAAYLHDFTLAAGGWRPDFAVSVDMIGGTGHLIIEQSPDHLPSPIAAAFEAAARHVSPPHLSYSHAVTLPTWQRAVTPFVGASDHLLFADRNIAIPAAHIAHWPDPAHHTSHDTVDRIDPDTLTRTTVTCAAAITALSAGGAALADIEAGIRDIAASRLAFYLANSDSAMTVPYVRQLSADASATLHRWHPAKAPPAEPPVTSPQSTGPALIRAWVGPWNLHNLWEALDTAQRARLASLLGAGGPRYAQLVGLALAIDNQTDITNVIRRARLATGLNIDPQDAAEFIAIMGNAGWTRLANPADRQR